jgi:O-antigen/teichoic acid export membrane protein
VTAFISIIINVSLFVLSKEFLYFILGHSSGKWLPAADALRLLCIYGAVRSLLEPVGSVIMAIGRTSLFVKATMLAAILEIIFVFPALKYYGIEGVAVLVTLSYASQYLIYFPALKRDIDLHYSDVFKAVKPALIAGLILLTCEKLFTGNFSSALTLPSMGFKFIVSVGGFCLIYSYFSKRSNLKEALSLLKLMRH